LNYNHFGKTIFQRPDNANNPFAQGCNDADPVVLCCRFEEKSLPMPPFARNVLFLPGIIDDPLTG